MHGILLQNDLGILGLALIEEDRKIQDVAFLSPEYQLLLSFTNGEAETLPIEIDREFHIPIYKNKKILIAHYDQMSFEKDPVREYQVALKH